MNRLYIIHLQQKKYRTMKKTYLIAAGILLASAIVYGVRKVMQ